MLVLHLVILPLNIKRLHELRQLLRDIKRAAEAGFSFEPMIPFLTKRTFKAGHVLFRRGERATCLFLVSRGSVRLPEIDVLVREEGAMICATPVGSPPRQSVDSANQARSSPAKLV